MSLWVIIPVKPLRRGKSRLSGVLTEDERSILNNDLLENTLRALNPVSQVNNILVISRDPAALSLARDYGARTVQEDSNSELNNALERATEIVKKYGGGSLMILPADLPLITSADIRDFLSITGQPPEVVIAPDRRGDGTNALFTNPVGSINYQYGPGSYRNHVKQAEEKNMRVEICRLPKFGLDLDLPEDLEILQRVKTHQFIL